MTVTDYDVRSLYLDLLRRNLTRYGMHERMPSEWPLRRRLLFKAVNTLHSLRNDTGQRGRELGLDWPAEAETMIGMQRLTSLQHCVETALAEDIPGDLIECGVWRGGACILMRAVLAAYGDETRRVWLADSFQGVPRSDPENYQADKGIRADFAAGILGVSEAEVRANFERYGLLDDRSAFFLAGSKTRCRTLRLIASRCCGSTATCTSPLSKRSTRCTRACRPGVSASSMTTRP